MLKLEKVAKTLEISITLRKRERLFNRALLQAFAFAAALHLVGLLLFHVSPFKITGNQGLIPPIVVDADISLGPEAAVIAQIESEDTVPRAIREPKGSSFTFPDVPFTDPNVLPLSTPGKRPSDKNPLVPLEKEILTDALLETKRNHAPIELHISGPLAQAPLNTLSLGRPSIHLQEPYRAMYDVRLDETTGSIFWLKPLHTPVNSALDQQAEQILRELRFAEGSPSISESGMVEIYFYPEELSS